MPNGYFYMEVDRVKNKYHIEGDTTIIEIHYEGDILHTYIDTENLPLVQVPGITWYGYRDGVSDRIYVQAHKYHSTIKMHRVIMRCTNSRQLVDHIDHNTLNNRKSNLHIVDRRGNALNSRLYKTNKSGYRSVAWHKGHNKWHVQVRVNQKDIHIGYYADLLEAARVATQARLAYGLPVDRKPIKIPR